MSVRVRGLALVGAIALFLGASGCTSVVEGDAVRPQGLDGLFDPCSIPDEALSQLGVDASTEESGIGEVRMVDFDICSWNSSWFNLNVWSTYLSLEVVKGNRNILDVRDVAIPGREAAIFRQAGSVDDSICMVAMGAEQGALMVRIDADYGAPGPHPRSGPPCDLAVEETLALLPYLPK